MADKIEDIIERVRKADDACADTWKSYATILANEVERLRELHRPRRAENGEWPEEGDSIHAWTIMGWTYIHNYSAWPDMAIWLPAPPKPEGK